MIKVNANKLQEAIDYVKDCLSEDDNRPVLKCLHLMLKEDSLIVEAVDGYKMARAVVKVIAKSEESFEALVKPFPVSVDKLGIFNVCLEIVNGYLEVLEQNGERHSHITLAGEYLRTDSILAVGEPSFVIHFNPRYLMNVMKKYKVNRTNKPEVVMEFHGEFGACIIHSLQDGKDKQHLILPLRK